ncbi:MAG TPA: radical SAM protein [Phycisphaerae bacterium]|nr:radical SAM protein [Phycisphaerae bacterium]
MIAFGPVPSRRLGRSLGINNIPPKTCTYSCVYCQLGRTTKMQVERGPFNDPEEILRAVQDKVEKAREVGEPVDYLTFVADGEPALDINLGQEIELLKQSGIPIAVITNSSLVWREDVREALLEADWVSLKVDAVEEETWRGVDRPHGMLGLAAILNGVLEFGRDYAGTLATETMLVADLNDGPESIARVADFLARLRPAAAYLSIPTRPPAEAWAHAPDEEALNRAYQILSDKVGQVEYLIGYEGDAFAFTGNVEEDLLSITAVHPMREDAVSAFLARAAANWSVVKQLIERDQIVQTVYRGDTFYQRRLKERD